MAIVANDPDSELRFICSKLKDEADNAQFELRVWVIEVERLTDEMGREIDLLEDLHRQTGSSDDRERLTSEIKDQQNNINRLSRELDSARNEQRKWQDQAAIIERQMDANRCGIFL